VERMAQSKPDARKKEKIGLLKKRWLPIVCWWH